VKNPRVSVSVVAFLGTKWGVQMGSMPSKMATVGKIMVNHFWLSVTLFVRGTKPT
jgi:hypothetical protein